MVTQNVIAHADPITHDDLKELAELEGPVVTLLVPTHRSGPETTTDHQQLRELLDTARAELSERYPDTDADALLAPVEKLRDDEPFWQQQVDGLAVVAAPGTLRYFRTDAAFDRHVTVGDEPNLRPLIPLVAGDLEFLLLAVSQDQVRLFTADRATITELDLGDIPHSTYAVDGVDTHKPLMQNRGGGAPGTTHGHVTGEDNIVNGFLQATGKALENRFSGTGKPLVVASVREYGNSLADALNTVTLLGHPVAGNPDHLSGPELHEHAWPLVEEEADKRHADQTDSFGEALGTGLASSDPADVLSAADMGRVEKLLFTETELEVPQDVAKLDAAVARTLRTGGSVDVVPSLPGGEKFGAIYRY